MDVQNPLILVYEIVDVWFHFGCFNGEYVFYTVHNNGYNIQITFATLRMIYKKKTLLNIINIYLAYDN